MGLLSKIIKRLKKETHVCKYNKIIERRTNGKKTTPFDVISMSSTTIVAECDCGRKAVFGYNSSGKREKLKDL